MFESKTEMISPTNFFKINLRKYGNCMSEPSQSNAQIAQLGEVVFPAKRTLKKEEKKNRHTAFRMLQLITFRSIFPKRIWN